MMKKMKRLLSVLVAVFCLVTLTACGSGGGGASGGTVKPGVYELTKATSANTGEPSADFEMMMEFGIISTLTLNEDGTGELNMFGTPIKIDYSKDDKTITIYGDTMEFTYKDKTVTFTWEENILDFTEAAE